MEQKILGTTNKLMSVRTVVDWEKLIDLAAIFSVVLVSVGIGVTIGAGSPLPPEEVAERVKPIMYGGAVFAGLYITYKVAKK